MFILLIFSACSDDEINPESPSNRQLQIRAVDASFLPKLENLGVSYKNENNQVQDALEIFKNKGVNFIRIRLWHSPEDATSGFEEVKQFAQRVHNEGLDVWLTVHYSDTWADPAQQQIPAAWQQADFETLKDSVYQYTQKIVREIQPEIIQIGNEINNGFLFPEGNRWENQQQFKELILRGIDAVEDENPQTKIMLHYAGIEGAQQFYTFFDDTGLDHAGISYYPQWHGTNLHNLGQQLSALRINSGREVVLAETAYPFTLDWNDNTNNITGLASQLIPGIPATPEGQKEYMEQIVEILRESGGIGFSYWGAEWVTSTQFGSTWENQALFDFNNTAVPAMEIFNQQ